MLRNALQRAIGESHKPTPTERAQLVLQGARLNTLLSVLTIPGVALFTVMLRVYSPSGRLAIWTISACAVMAFASVRNLRFLTSDSKRPDRFATNSLVSLPIENAAVGSATLIALPPDAAGQLVMLVMIVVAMAGNIITRSLTRSIHYSSQIPLVATAASGYLIAGSPVTAVALAVLGYCLIAGFIMSRLLRASALQSLRVANQNEELVLDLHVSNVDLQRKSHTDALTGLLNRSGFVAELENILDGGRLDVRAGEQPPDCLAVLFVDLNRFKAVNDSLGHAAGDALLIEAARRLSGCVRPSDIVARIGGDELTIAAPGINGDGAYPFAERVAAVFNEPFELAGTRRNVSASIGVAYGLIEEFDVEDLLAGSDAALYAAKGDTTSHIAVFDEQARAQATSERQLRRDLITAFDQDEIVAHWQPLVCHETGDLIGAESLARWNHNGRVRAAGEFIDALTQAGLERRLADVMMSDARKARELIPDTSIVLGINVSPSTIRRLLDCPDNAGLWPGLVLEITEHELIDDLDAVRDAIAEVRTLGARVYLDDFGTGYSSLSLLADLDIDGLKIDRHFVNTIDQVSSYRIVADIAEIGRRRGYPVVAEGIETEEQLRLVTELGIEFGQGYLFGRPMDLERFAEVAHGTELPWTASFANRPGGNEWVDGIMSGLRATS